MQRFDKVMVKYDFDIVSYVKDIFVCKFYMEEGILTYPIPSYLNSFGVGRLGSSYVVPGSQLPKEHPDYYKYTANGYVYSDNEPIDLILSDSFDDTGKYNISYKGSLISKQAALKTESQIRADALKWVSNSSELYTGSMLVGTILYFAHREARNVDVQDDTYELVDTYEEAKEKQARPPQGMGSNADILPILCLIKEQYSLVEFFLPTHLLKMVR